MVAHVAHNFAIQTKIRNQKEAMIYYGNEVMIKLRNFQSKNSLKKFDKLQNLHGGYQWATDKGSPSVAHI